MLFSIKKIYFLPCVLSSIENVLDKKISVNNYTYVICKNVKDTQAVIKLLPKSNDFVLYNSFLPELTIKILDGKLVVEYSLARSVKILFVLISLFMIFLEVGLLLKTDISNYGNKLNLFLVPLIYFIQVLFTALGFLFSYKIVEKKVLKLLKNNQ